MTKSSKEEKKMKMLLFTWVLWSGMRRIKFSNQREVKDCHYGCHLMQVIQLYDNKVKKNGKHSTAIFMMEVRRTIYYWRMGKGPSFYRGQRKSSLQ